MEAFISAANVVARYSRYGKGEKVVVFLHGYGESIEVWEEVGGFLGKEFDIVAIDLPGSGISTFNSAEPLTIDYMADVVMEVLSKLSIEEYSVVAHSMGGYVATALMEKDEKRLQRVVMFHSLPYGDSDEKREVREREMAIIESGKKEMLAQSNPTKGFAPQNVKRCSEAIDEKIEQFMLTDDEALIATLKGMASRRDLSEVFKIFSKSHPVLTVFGMFDPYISEELREKAISDFPDMQVVVLENSAHMGFKEELDRTVVVLQEFLA